jgi:transcriptional regulator with XRE-family HTH domain
MSQADFARKLNISEAYASQLASGVRKFTFIMEMRAALILKCSPTDLYVWVNE